MAEGWQYAPEPRDILFGSYVQEWYKDVWSHFPEGTKKGARRANKALNKVNRRVAGVTEASSLKKL